jgi:integrase
MPEQHHEMMDGRLHVYKRENSRYWQCSAFLADRNWRVSTKTDSFSEAKDIAEDWYLGLRGKLKAGTLKHERTFEQAAEQFRTEYETLVGGERHPQYVEGHWRRLKNYLLPFFGPLGLSEVTRAKVQEYRIRRKKDTVPGKKTPPSRSTIHQEIVVLRQVLKTAELHGWISAIPNLSAPYKTSGKITHRAWFSPEEYKQLYEATRERVQNPRHNKHRNTYFELHNYVLFMANTGLRPDESRRIEFRDVKIVDDRDSGQTILEIDVRGKRGVGFCKSMPGAVHPFRLLSEHKRPKRVKDASGKETIELAKPGPTDLVFPNTHHELFNIILEEQDLKFDREGQRRTFYSLRHTYICLRLMEGADVYQVAKNCRTSVQMIEEFYASHIKNMVDASNLNMRRSRSMRPARARTAPKRPRPLRKFNKNRRNPGR